MLAEVFKNSTNDGPYFNYLIVQSQQVCDFVSISAKKALKAGWSTNDIGKAHWIIKFETRELVSDF